MSRMRKYYLDNARYLSIFLVLIIHVVEPTFEIMYPQTPTSGSELYAVSYITYFVLAWMLNLFFVIAGICARYSLARNGYENRKPGAFLVSRARSLLLPSFGYMIFLGWIPFLCSFGDLLHPFRWELATTCLKILMGPMWFCFQLFSFTAILALIVLIDKKDFLYRIGNRVWAYILFLIPIMLVPMYSYPQHIGKPVFPYLYGPPDESFFANICFFFAGYVIFSHEKAIEFLKKFWYALLIPGTALGIYVTITLSRNIEYYPGWVERLYSWIMTPAVLAVFIRFLNKNNRFTKYMSRYSFPYLVLQFPSQYIAAWIAVQLDVPRGYAMYAVIFVLLFIIMQILAVVIKRIPGLRFILFREGKPKPKKEPVPDTA